VKQFGRSRRDGGTPALPTQLDGLLEDMRDLRLTLVADLNAAAGAAEAGADTLAEEILEADQRELARFARMADARLLRLQRLADGAEEQPQPRRTWRRRIAVMAPVAPVVGAMAIAAAAATGVLPVPGHGNSSQTAPRAAAVAPIGNLPASSSFRQFANVVGSDPSAKQVIAAATRLHRQLARLIASSPNPRQADRVAELLRMEQSLLLQAQPPGARVVLDATRRLAARLVTVTPRTTSPTTVTGNLLTTAPSPKPHKSTSPTASPKPKTTSPRPKPSSPKATPTSGTSSSPSSTNTFPALPG
jgi:hypothetical protein